MRKRIGGYIGPWAVITLLCLLFGMVSVASAASFSLTSLKWASSTVDTTLNTKRNPLKVNLTVKVTNTIKDSNKVAVTIRNTNTKAELTAYTKKGGGTAAFDLHNADSHTGKWEIVSVRAVKHTQEKVGKLPGYWLNGVWHPSVDVVKDNYKTLKTIKVSKPALTVTCGAKTKLSLTADASLLASETTIALTATLKDAKGKPVANQTVKFQLAPGLTSKNTTSSSYAPVIAKAKTDAKGVAKVSAKVPQVAYSNTEFRGFTTTAYYEGKAKKYCASESASRETTQPKEKTHFVVAPTWDGHTGTRTFTVKLAVKSGKNKGKAIADVPVEWSFKTADKGELYQSASKKTDKSGISSITWDVQKWADFDVSVGAKLSSMKATPYAPPDGQVYRLGKKQGVQHYTVDMSKITLLGGPDATGDWFSATSAAKMYLTVASAEGVLVGKDGKALEPIGTVEPKFLRCSIVGDGSVPMVQDKNVEFSLNAANILPVKIANRFTLNSGEARAARQLRITFTLPTFENPLSPEYKFVPLQQAVTATLPGTGQ